MSKSTFNTTINYISVVDKKDIIVNISDNIIPVKFYSKDGEELQGKTDVFKTKMSVVIGVLKNSDERFSAFYEAKANTMTDEVKIELLSRLLKGAEAEVSIETKVAGDVYTKFGVELTVTTDVVLTSLESIKVTNPDGNKFLDQFKPRTDADFFASLL